MAAAYCCLLMKQNSIFSDKTWTARVDFYQTRMYLLVVDVTIFPLSFISYTFVLP